jgi:hypothetical protein
MKPRKKSTNNDDNDDDDDDEDSDEDSDEDEVGEGGGNGMKPMTATQSAEFTRKLDKLFRYFFQEWQLIGLVRYPKEKPKRKGVKTKLAEAEQEQRNISKKVKPASNEGRKRFEQLFS